LKQYIQKIENLFDALSTQEQGNTLIILLQRHRSGIEEALNTTFTIEKSLRLDGVLLAENALSNGASIKRTDRG